MKKATKQLGVLSLIISAFSVFAIVSLLIDLKSPGADWTILIIYYYTLIIIGMLAIILTIPFLIILINVKFKNMKFYAFSHLFFVLLTITIFILSSI